MKRENARLDREEEVAAAAGGAGVETDKERELAGEHAGREKVRGWRYSL